MENAWIHGILPAKSHKGTIRITVEAKGRALLINVEDDGEGMEPAELDRLRIQLSQTVLQPRTPANKGFGIALMNVNDRIKLVDGEEYGLFIESVKGRGSRVTVKQKFEVSPD